MAEKNCVVQPTTHLMFSVNDSHTPSISIAIAIEMEGVWPQHYSVHNAVGFYYCRVTMFWNLIGTANSLATEVHVAVWTHRSCVIT